MTKDPSQTNETSRSTSEDSLPAIGDRRIGRASFHLPIQAPEPSIGFKGAPRPDARVQYYAPLYGTDSYANVAGAFAHALVERVAGISICNYLGGAIEDPVLVPCAGLNHRTPVGIFFGLPTHAPEIFFEHVIRIGIFVCEADQILPGWVRLCNRFNLIVVPSQFCRRAFLRSGVTTPVMVVPHGVHPAHRPRSGFRDGDRFVFYNTFRRQVAERKGYQELIRCFQAAFQGRDDVVLRLRAGDPGWLPACPGWPDYGGLVTFDPPDSRSMDEAAAVYSRVHCTVHPTKGEGFGLVPLESIACQTPVIAPAHTGMADYLDEDNAILLRSGETIRAPRVDHQCGCYHAVDEEHLVELLRYAREHWEEERDQLQPIAERTRQWFAWPRVLQPFVDLVEAALDCGDSWEFSRLTAGFLDPGEVERNHDEARDRARAPTNSGRAGDGQGFRFSSIVYCGWDYPQDGVGNHLRLLDGLIFDRPEIRFKSFDEQPGSYWPEPWRDLASYVHHQRPDLFRGGLYLDVVGFHGDQAMIRQQINRVAEFRERFAARTAIYLMWESDRLWAPMLELVKACDLTIVTSSLLQPYLRERSVPHVMLPHPYQYHIERPAAQPDSGGVITLGISAGLWPRKNLAPVVEAFAEVHGNHPGFRLCVHTRSKPDNPVMAAENQRIERAASTANNIEYRCEALSREEYLRWMKSLDVYCFMSSGEGWSVTPREALHLGRPVILLDAHVHADFSHLPGVIRVAPGPPRPARPGMAFIDSDIGREASIDPASFRQVMVDLPDRYRAARAALVSGFDEVLDHHSLDLYRKQWVDALNKPIDQTAIDRYYAPALLYPLQK